MQDTAEELGLDFIFVARLTQPVQKLCRHDDAHWSATEVPGIEVQEREGDRPGRRLILLRTRIAERPPRRRKGIGRPVGGRARAAAKRCSKCPATSSRPW